MFGQTNINNTKFTYCNLDSANLSNTYNMNNSNFYFSSMYRSKFINSIGKYVNF